MGQRGRPRTKPPAYWVWHDPVRCVECGMTYRSPYATKAHEEIEQGGQAPNGKPYTHVAWRMCTCNVCGRRFTVRVLENREPTAAAVCE